MVNLASTPETAATTKPAQTVTVHILRFLAARLREGSSIRGLLLMGTAAGVFIRPEAQEVIVSVGLALSGIIGLIVPEAGAPEE